MIISCSFWQLVEIGILSIFTAETITILDLRTDVYRHRVRQIIPVGSENNSWYWIINSNVQVYENLQHKGLLSSTFYDVNLVSSILLAVEIKITHIK